MPEGKLYPISSKPGIKRDGAEYTDNYYIDGQWVRFQRGLPRKIGGYKRIQTIAINVVRAIIVIPVSPNFHVYTGDQQFLLYTPIDLLGNAIGAFVDRSPAGFVVNANTMWQFDTLFVTVSNDNQLIAHAAPNLASIDSTVETPIYYGPAAGNTPLIQTGFLVSGGIVTLNPYLIAFGNDGTVLIFAANDPTTLVNTVRIANQKIVAGAQTRGGNSSPAGLLWSLNALIRMTFVGTAAGPEFAFDTITDQSSILSSNSIIEYDSRYFWCGVDRFLVYNGVVQEVPNQLNLNYFFQNLNYAQRQKVWATKVPQFGEIWWHYPFGDATECNHAVIYNVRENTWYDTAINRSAGYYEQVFADPIWSSSTIEEAPFFYGLWQHETGNDKVTLDGPTAIPCHIETSDISWCAIGPTGAWNGTDRQVDLYRVEPDFWQQSGDITLSVKGRQYAQSTTVQSTDYTLAVSQEKLDLREQRRFMTLKFANNAIGGFFELGQLLLYLRVGDARP